MDRQAASPRRRRAAGPCAVLILGGFLLALSALLGTEKAQAATLKISGECRNCPPATPAGPGLAFTRMRQVIEVNDIAAFTSIVATQTGPGGTVTLQGCRPFGNVGERSAELFTSYKGNGAYSVVVKTYTRPDGSPGFAECTGEPAREDAISYSITAAADSAGTGTPVVSRTSGTERRGFVQGIANSGLNDSETFWARDGVTGPDGGLLGSPSKATTALDLTQSGSTGFSFLVPTPGLHTVVTRPLAQVPPASDQDLPGPWSPPAQIKVKTRFDTDPSKLLDAKAPTYGLRMNVDTPEARGTKVRAAVVLCTAGTGCNSTTDFKRPRDLGTKVIGADGTLTFRGLRLPRGKISGVRLTHPGSDLIVPGSVIQVLRVFAFSGTAKLRFAPVISRLPT